MQLSSLGDSQFANPGIPPLQVQMACTDTELKALANSGECDKEVKRSLFLVLCSSRLPFMVHFKISTSFQQFRPKPVQWSGTIRKYLSIASQNLVLYNSGETTVGILPCPPKIPVDFTTISSFLSHVNVRI